MPFVVDTLLGLIYVGTGTVYTVTPEIAKRQNVTGTEDYPRHAFEHTFMLMTFQFIVQAACLPLWYFVTGGQTRARRPEDEEPLGGWPRQIDQEQPEDDDRLINPGGNQVNIQGGDPNVDQGDGDEELLVVQDDDDREAEGENQPARPAREPIIPNNPAWNQRPVDQTKFNPFLFLPPALFDLFRYGLLYIAIRLTYRSSYMMIRAGSVIFTVLLRVAFLSKHMAKYMWVSISMVVIGLGLIGMTDYVHETPPGYDRYGLAAGDLLIAMSQILIAMQFVYEEKFMDKHSIDPLRVVGMEGCYAALVSIILLVPFTYLESGPFSTLPHSHIVDLKDAFLQMRSSSVIAICVVGAVFSKVVYFYVGTKLVKRRHDSALRITVDVHHDLIIWGISLGAGWQNYFWPQIIGYIMVPIGMMAYNDILPLPKFCLPPEVPRPQQGPLPGEAINLEAGNMPDENNPDEQNPQGQQAGGQEQGQLNEAAHHLD